MLEPIFVIKGVAIINMNNIHWNHYNNLLI